MGLTKKFLVDTANLEEIIEKLRTVDNLPDKLDTEYLEELGYTNPPDFLILNFFKELNLLTKHNIPTSLFKQFRNEKISKNIFAYGIVQAYGDLFEQNPAIFKQPKSKILEELRSLLGDEKSDLILKYMANTFSALVDYVGPEYLESLLDNTEADTSNIEKVVQEIAHKYRNGDTDFEAPPSIVANGEHSAPVTEQSGSEGFLHESEAATDKGKESPEVKEKDSLEEEVDDPASQSQNRNHAAGAEEEDTDKKTELPKEPQQPTKLNGTPEEQKNGKPSTSGHSSPKADYVNKAIIRKAALLFKLGKLEEALTAADKVYQRFAESENPELYEEASAALVNKMNTAEKLEREEELDSIYSEIIDRLGSSQKSRFIESVDHAFVQKAKTLFDNSKDGDALDITEQAIDRFKGTERKQDFLGMMMFRKAEMLDKEGSEEKALEAYDAFLEHFG